LRLVRIKPVPIVRFYNRVPRPVRRFEIFENDSRILVLFRGVAPDIEVLVGKVVTGAGVDDPGGCRGYSTSGLLEPRILIGSVINHEFGNDAQVTLMCSVEERPEVIQRAEIWIDVEIIGDVVAVVAQRGRIEWQQPDGSDPQLLQIIQLFD